MAIRGRKRAPAALRLVTGVPSRAPVNPAAPVADGRPEPPVPLSGRVAELWAAFIGPAWWLAALDAHTAYAWCVLAAEFEETGGTMTAARIAQLRCLASDLGLSPAARTRLSAGKKPGESDPLARYFVNGAA